MRERWLSAALILAAALVVSRGSPALGGDGAYYLAISHSLVHDADLDLRNELDASGSFLYQREADSALTRATADGRLAPTVGLGYGAALVPLYWVSEQIAGAIPDSLLGKVRWNRARAARDLISLVLAALAAFLACLTLSLSRELGVAPRGLSFMVLAAFLAPPMILAAIQPTPELVAALLLACFARNQVGGRSPLVAGVLLALLPWAHLRFGAVAIWGSLWLGRRSKASALLPLVSLAVLFTLNRLLFGWAWPDTAGAGSIWRWAGDLPSHLFSLDVGLLWVAPLWLLAVPGLLKLRETAAAYAAFVGGAVVAALLLADAFTVGGSTLAPGLALAPVLPLLVPAVARGLTPDPRRRWSVPGGVLVAWSLLMFAVVLHEPRRVFAEPGGGIGRLPQRGIELVRDLRSAKARLTRLGVTPDEAGFAAGVRSGRIDVVALFLEAGFLPDSVLETAVDAGQVEVLKRLASQPALDGTGAARALALAMERGNSEAMGALKSAGFTIDSPNVRGETALMMAVAGRDSSDRTRLINLGAGVNARSRTGQTALMFAVLARDAAATRDLIAAGADVDLPDLDGWTPLMTAARLGLVEQVADLIKGGANVNAASRIGWTALMWAAYDGRTDVIALLLAAGADPNVMSRAGQSALIRAAAGGHVEAVRRLLAAGARTDLALDEVGAREWAARNNQAAVVALLDAGRRP